MKIDACVFLGDSIYGNEISAEGILEQMDDLQVDKAIIRPNKPSDYCYKRANEGIAATAQKQKRFIPFGRLNPLEKTAVAQLEEFPAMGLKGLHLHPWEDNFQINDPKFDELFDAAAALCLPVYVNAGYPQVSQPLQMYECALRHSDVIFIATHGAQLDISGMSFDDAIIAANAENLYFDLSGIYRRDFLERLITKTGRTVFASCSPYMNMRLETARINAVQVSEAEKDKIFGGNIMGILEKGKKA